MNWVQDEAVVSAGFFQSLKKPAEEAEKVVPFNWEDAALKKVEPEGHSSSHRISSSHNDAEPLLHP